MLKLKVILKRQKKNSRKLINWRRNKYKRRNLRKWSRRKEKKLSQQKILKELVAMLIKLSFKNLLRTSLEKNQRRTLVLKIKLIKLPRVLRRKKVKRLLPMQPRKWEKKK